MKIRYAQSTNQKQKFSRRTVILVASSVFVFAVITAFVFFNLAPNKKSMAAGPNRYWVGQTGVITKFCDPSSLNSWQLANNNGSASSLLNSNGTLRVKVDDAQGGFSVSLNNMNGLSANQVIPDVVSGKIEISINEMSAGQKVTVMAGQFNPGGNLVSTIALGPAITSSGSFPINLNSVQFSSAMQSIQFGILIENTTATQGYTDLISFSYTDSKISWSNSANWSVSSNGPGGAGAPGLTGLAIFDAASGDCFMDVPVNVLGIDLLTTFNKNLLQGPDSLNINSSDFDILGGTFIGSSAPIQLNNGRLRYTGGTFVSTSGTVITKRDLTLTGPAFFHNKGKIFIDDNSITITSSVQLYDLIFSSKTSTRTLTVPTANGLNIQNSLVLEGNNRIDMNSGGTVYLQGNLHLLNTFKGGQGSANIVFNGEGDQFLHGSQSAGLNRLSDDVIVDKPSGTLFITGVFSPVRNLTYITGNIDASKATLCLTSSSSTIKGNWTFKELIFDSNGSTPAINSTYTIADNSTITVLEKTTITGTSNSIINKIGTGKITLLGNLELNSTGSAGAGSCLFSFEGTGDQEIMGFAQPHSSRIPHIIVNKPSGTLKFNGNISSSGDFEYISGNIDPGNSTFIFAANNSIKGKATFFNLTFSKNTTGTNTHSIQDTVTVLNNYEQNGLGTITLNGGQFDVHKNIIVSNSASGGNSSNIINICGTSDQILSGTTATGQGRLGGITIDKSIGTLFLENFITMTRNWTYINGIVIPGTSTVLMGSNYSTVTSGNGSESMSFHNLLFYSSLTYLGSNLNVNANLDISPSTTLDASISNYTINLKGNWTNYGTFTRRDGTVILNGNTKQIIASNTKENFQNLHFANTAIIADAIQIDTDVQVYKNLKLETSKVFLNNYNLTIGSGRTSSTIGSLNVVKGWLHGGSVTRWLLNTRIAENDTMGFFPLGSAWDSRGVYISNPAVATNGGAVTIVHTPSAMVTPVNIPDAGSIIVGRLNANWMISNSGITTGTFNLRIGGTGFGTISNINDLRLTAVSTVVANPGLNSGTTTFPWIQRLGLTALQLNNQIYVGTTDGIYSPLPVKLLTFKVQLENEKVICKWSTATELNNDYFNVEHSIDGIQFETVGKVIGSGTSNQTRFYEFKHNEAKAGVNYYRLKQTDFDGKFENFDPVAIKIKIDSEDPAFIINNVYPNPFINQFNIEVKSNSDKTIDITLYTSNGSSVLKKQVNLTSGFNEISVLSESELSPGTYVLNLTDGEGNTQSYRLIRKN